MKKVMISAVGGPPSVSYIKHLKNLGLFVVGIDCDKESVGKFFCDEFLLSPPVTNSEGYLGFLSSIKFDYFFPWLDEEHKLLAKEKSLFNFSGKIVTSAKETIDIVTDKINTFNFALKNGINVPPKTVYAPAFVRKRFSRGSKYCYLEYDQSKINSLNFEEHIIQEYIEGDEYTVDILCLDDMFYAVPRKRVKASNVSTVGKIEMNPDIITFCKNIVNRLDFFGPINIQLIHSKKDDNFYLIEINPRIAGTAILSIHSGFDMIKATIDYLENKELDFNFKIKNNLKMYRYWEEHYVP